jgi:hypothetical protein
MNRSRLSVTIGSIGFTLVAASVVMAFLVDHHWYVTYQTALSFERTMWWVQLAGALLAIVGCVGMSAFLPKGAALRTGLTFMAIGLILPLLFGAILNIHDWEISLLLPMVLVLFDGAMLGIVGYLRQR